MENETNETKTETQTEIKTDQQIELKKFPLKIELELMKKLNKILREGNQPYTELEYLKLEDCGLMDPSNCMMVYPKTTEAKLLLCRFSDKDNRLNKKPNLDYAATLEGENKIQCNYSIEFLIPVLDFFKVFQKLEFRAVTLNIRKNYPMTIFNDHFEIIIAPQVNNN